MKNNIIEELRSDKLRLQQKVAYLEELLKRQATKEEKQVQQVKPGIQLKAIIHLPQDFQQFLMTSLNDSN